jgi:hypothetical protein
MWAPIDTRLLKPYDPAYALRIGEQVLALKRSSPRERWWGGAGAMPQQTDSRQLPKQAQRGQLGPKHSGHNPRFPRASRLLKHPPGDRADNGRR